MGSDDLQVRNDDAVSSGDVLRRRPHLGVTNSPGLCFCPGVPSRAGEGGGTGICKISTTQIGRPHFMQSASSTDCLQGRCRGVEVMAETQPEVAGNKFVAARQVCMHAGRVCASPGQRHGGSTTAARRVEIPDEQRCCPNDGAAIWIRFVQPQHKGIRTRRDCPVRCLVQRDAGDGGRPTRRHSPERGPMHFSRLSSASAQCASDTRNPVGIGACELRRVDRCRYRNPVLARRVTHHVHHHVFDVEPGAGRESRDGGAIGRVGRPKCRVGRDGSEVNALHVSGLQRVGACDTRTRGPLNS